VSRAYAQLRCADRGEGLRRRAPSLGLFAMRMRGAILGGKLGFGMAGLRCRVGLRRIDALEWGVGG
jgi:hypothetical protein